MSSTKKKKQPKFKEPEVSASEQDRKKLVVLGIFAGVVILLLWFFTMPYNYEKQEGESNANPVGFFGTIKDQISIGGGRMGNYVEDLGEAPRTK